MQVPLFQEGPASYWSPSAPRPDHCGNTRDPMLFSAEAQPGLLNLHLVYSANALAPNGVWMRTLSAPATNASAILRDWGAWGETRGSLVAFDGIGPEDCACPFVLQEGEYFYLFRTSDYFHGGGQTAVYASRDPSNFGVGAADAYLVARLPVAAPEVVRGSDGQRYLVALREGLDGMRAARLDFPAAAYV